jgi:hypothetical protein
MLTTNQLLESVRDAGEDFEWYPTTARMIEVVAQRIPSRTRSILDIGAGDGRVLVELAKKCEDRPELYAIEKSVVLVQAQPEEIIPLGTDLFEQNLTCLPVDYIFCNPPYSEFETWAAVIIESGYAQKAFLVIPTRWADSKRIQAALTKRGATARAIHTDDFLDAERSARAVVNIVEVSYPKKFEGYGGRDEPADPFDAWFDQNIDTFDHEEEDVPEYKSEERELAKLRHLETIPDMVAAFDEEYARMEANYRAIFKLDYAILKELGVSKDHVRDGIKKRMAGLKNKYWHLLFEKLDTITKRLATETKQRFLERLTGRATIAFTCSNAYAVAIWAIKNANKYYDEQLVKLFRDLSTYDGVLNYKSNQRTWQKDGWRFNAEELSHYALDYRIVVRRYYGIVDEHHYHADATGNLAKTCHELLDDVIAVFNNLGFTLDYPTPSRRRQWSPNAWQDFHGEDQILFQAKAFKNGNLHFRMMPAAIKALNVEAGRLLGWLRSREDVVAELGYTAADASKYFGLNHKLVPSSVKLLAGPAAETV